MSKDDFQRPIRAPMRERARSGTGYLIRPSNEVKKEPIPYLRSY